MNTRTIQPLGKPLGKPLGPQGQSKMAVPRLTTLAKYLWPLLLLLSLWQVGSGVYIYGKAQLAQWLLMDAWQKTLAGQQYVKPWSWADTWPVFRLMVPEQGIDRIVLAGASGRVLAFGPGHVSATPLPGEPGNSVVGGHRDSHFSFLQQLNIGDTIVVETADQRQVVYQVIAQNIVDHRDTRLMAQTQQLLTLITCYPFDQIQAGGPLRYVVSAKPVSGFL